MKYRTSLLILSFVCLTMLSAVVPVSALTMFYDGANLKIFAEQGKGGIWFDVHYRDTPTTFTSGPAFFIKNKDVGKDPPPYGEPHYEVPLYFKFWAKKVQGKWYVLVHYDPNGGGDGDPITATPYVQVPKRPS